MGYFDANGQFRTPGDVLFTALADLKASNPDSVKDAYRRVQLRTANEGRTFYYHPTSVLTADDLFVVTPATGAGRFLLLPGTIADISLPIAFGTADATALATLPTGFFGRVARGYWHVTASFTGGTASTIGLSSDQTGFSTKGDILGGAAGDVAATLVQTGAGKMAGTIGAKIAAGVFLNGGQILRFDAITSAFTAGTGFAHLIFDVLANPG